jgi:polysaccharide biosynthesis/export protein
MSRPSIGTYLIAFSPGAITLSGCSSIPTSGPSSAQISRESGSPSPAGIQIVDVTDEVARKLFSERNAGDFSSTLGNNTLFQQQLGLGDTIEVSICRS